MRPACVELAGDQTRTWIECGDIMVRPLDTVKIRVGTLEYVASVLVAPEQLLAGTAQTSGDLVEVLPVDTRVDDGSLPGANLPALGTCYRHASAQGLVTGVDPLTETITLATAEGEHITVPWMLTGVEDAR